MLIFLNSAANTRLSGVWARTFGEKNWRDTKRNDRKKQLPLSDLRVMRYLQHKNEVFFRAVILRFETKEDDAKNSKGKQTPY